MKKRAPHKWRRLACNNPSKVEKARREAIAGRLWRKEITPAEAQQILKKGE